MLAKIINYQEQNFSQNIDNIINKNSQINKDLSQIVADIIQSVKTGGDQQIIQICNKFDGADFKTSTDLLVAKEEIKGAKNRIDKKLLEALELAYQRIYSYHKKQLPEDFLYEDETGITLGNKWQAIEKIAVYVPGGTALYPSSVLMGAIPAIVSGAKKISVAVPSKNGEIDPAILAACEICNIDTIYKIGGTAAIAALAYGTKTIEKVDKIVGPGNSYVALAKKQLFGEVGIDMVAGPTDILIIADNKTNPDWIAADLLSQLEHGPDSSAMLITDDINFAQKVNDSISKLAPTLSRKDIIKQSLENNGKIVIVKDLEKDAAIISNKIAPEHLEIISENQNEIADQITNAGAIFLGKYSPEAIGDYLAGPNHTLPTMGTARFSSGLSVFDFLKRISIISASEKGFRTLQKPTALLAKTEGFEAHELSINIRNND